MSVTPSQQARDAMKFITLQRAAQALPGAQAAVQAEPDNPHHQFLLAQAQAGSSNYAEAAAAFDRAVELCPAYAAEVDPVREQVWATAFQQGLEAYQANDTAKAIANWQAATQVLPNRPDPYYNLGVIHGQQGRVSDAVQAYRRTLDVIGEMPADTSAEAMESRAQTRSNALTGLLAIGAQQFGKEQFGEAAEIFRTLNQLDPNNRDAWYNHALALYKQEKWNDLIPVARRLSEIDPLNYNAQIILFNAYKGISDQAKAQGNASVEQQNRNLALQTLEAADALPVQVDRIQLSSAEGGGGTLTGTVTGAKANAGSPVTLNFTFYGPEGQVGTQSVTVNAPAKDATTNFTVQLPAGKTVTSYSYRLQR